MKNRKIIIITLLVVVSLISSLFITIGLDYYWHITAGKYMFNNHTILTHDIFSWFLYNKSWISHEWLFENIIYVLKIIFGDYNVLVYCSICISSLLLIIFLNNKNYSKNTLFTMIWLMLFIIMNSYCIIPRPHMLSNILFAVTIYLLYDLKENEHSNKIYILPVISVLWSNIHGGSSNLSYILIILFIVTGLISFDNKYIQSNKLSKKQLKKYIITLIICILSICINPHGIKMLIYPYTNILDITMQQNITEWQSILKITPNNYIYFSFIIFLLIVLIKSKEKLKLTDLLLLILFIILGIKSFRFSNYIYIVSSFFIFNYIEKRENDKNTNIILITISIILLVLFILNISTIKMIISLKPISNKMITTIKKENPKRLFNLYDDGGYLISNEIKVFIDGRADLYSKYNYKDYINISNNINTKELINKYSFDYFLVNNKYKINDYLKNNADYIIVLKDNNNILYKKIVSTT